MNYLTATISSFKLNDMEKPRRRLITTIQSFCLVSLTLLALTFLALQIIDSRYTFKERAKEKRTAYMEQQKELTKNEMTMVLKTLEYQRSTIESQTRKIIHERTYEAYSIAQNIYYQNRDKSSAAIQKMIVDALRPMRFNEGTGYYFIYRRSDAANLLNGNNPNLEGNIHIETQDGSGTYIFREIFALSEQENEFYYQYLWSKPEEEGNQHKKLSFIKRFEPYDWIIGTGVYLEDAENHVKKALLDQIGAINYGKNNNGYFFVNDWNGNNLIHGAQPELIGTNMWDATDSHGTKTTQTLIALAKQNEGGFTEFWYPNPTTGIEEPNIIYAWGVHDWEWLIGSRVYTDEMEEGIAKLEEQVNRDLFLDLRNTIILTGLILFFFLTSFRIVNLRLLKDFSQFSAFFKQAANEDKEINQNKLRFAELYQMAESINFILGEKISAQNSVKDEKDRFEALHEATFGGVMILEQDTILDCNKSLSEITGYSPSELNGMRAYELISPEMRDSVQHSIETDYQGKYEAVGLRKDGSSYPLSLRGKSISYKGRHVRVMEIRDISERKEAEAALEESRSRLQNILQNLPIALAMAEKNGEVSFRNKRFTQLFGYSEDDIGSTDDWWINAYPNEKLRDRIIKDWTLTVQKAQQEDCFFDGFEAPISCKDGTQLEIEISGIPLNESILAAFIDVTERNRLEEERQNMEKLKTVGTLAGGLAHDFNNILTGLYGNLSLAKNGLSKENPAFPFIESAEKSMNTATQLTNQLLTFAKGGAPIKKSLSLAELIKEVINFNLSGSNVKAQINEPDDLWLANVDQGQMQQVFGNLTINAIQAMSKGGHLSVVMKNTELTEGSIADLEPGQYIQIVFSDEGDGITPDYLEHIFEPYFTTKKTGSGLGLATSYSIIKRHGGHISATSKLKEGTTFTLYIPATGTAPPLSKEKVTPTERAPKSAKILVMDDEKVIRITLAAMLQELSYTVETSSDGAEALELYRGAYERDEPFDLVILDLTIPGGIGGKETAQNIMDFDDKAKIVISSGYAEDQLMADHDKYKLTGVMAKPYNLSTLKETLARVLEE
jgi:two-component system, cell cycle sensor histidine kinase and response regulator CckA